MTESPTRQILLPATVSALVADALEAPVGGCAPLDGGGFAAVWRADLLDGRSVVAKVGPANGVALLEYETGMIAAEAEYLRLVHAHLPGVPLPVVLAAGQTPSLVDGEWVITTLCPGISLTADRGATGGGPAIDDAPVRRDLGVLLARLHTVTGDRFGYTGSRPHADTWPGAVVAIVESLVADARVWGMPVPADRIRAAVERCRPELTAVDRPALLHFDLWDGNVLAAIAPDGRSYLSGLVDGERFFFGDPLVDLVSPMLHGRIEDTPDHPVLAGYRAQAGVALAFDSGERSRIGLYRAMFYLLMLAEMPSRGMTGEAARERREWLDASIDRQLADLGV